jgi:hypothetical protein
MQKIVALIGVTVLGLAPPQGHADAKTDQRLADARQVFETFVGMREQVIRPGDGARLRHRSYRA